jgi:hypothetical protein
MEAEKGILGAPDTARDPTGGTVPGEWRPAPADETGETAGF